MSNKKTKATSIEALRAHAAAARDLSLVKAMSPEDAFRHSRYTQSNKRLYLNQLEDVVKKWYLIYTDPMGLGNKYIFQKKDTQS